MATPADPPRSATGPRSSEAATLNAGVHPGLAALAGRLRELAGDAAYQAGRDYLRKGLVKHGAVAATTAYATVTGSTDYRVSVAFGGEPRVTCTCPAHRRRKFCKHVVAVCLALLERPGDFAAAAAPPEAQQRPAPRRSARSAATGAERGHRTPSPQPAALRAAGLETVDRLLMELADGGLLGLGPDKLALLAGAGELVRALKLRRLGNLLVRLQRAVEQDRRSLEGGAFARLLADLYLTRRATGAHLEGRIQMDAQLAEDLLGKTWRDEELEPVAGLELMELAGTRRDDGEFRVETSYLADLPTGTIYAETQITPSHLSAPPKPRHRHRLLVDEAALYPGAPPRRLKLQRLRRAPLAAGDVERLLARVPSAVADLRRALVERMAVPFGGAEVAVAFRPAALVARDLAPAEATRSAKGQPRGRQTAAVDAEGRLLALDWAPRGAAQWSEQLPGILPPAGPYALFGLLGLGEDGLRLQCLSAVAATPAWAHGPVYPDDRQGTG